METTKRIGKQSVILTHFPSIAASAAVVGKKEGQGPLRSSFDYISEDNYFAEKSWEKAESKMQKLAFEYALKKAMLPPSALDYIFGGDLLNQCAASTFGMRESGIPFFGLYGACSTMAEALSLAGMAVDGGYAEYVCAVTSSHFCSAERQFRLPLEYGGQRTPSAQWTATASGAAVISAAGNGPYLTAITTGKIVDAGICDANNMGAAMAPAAYDTIHAHLTALGVGAEHYDLIVTGDLGFIGSQILTDFFRKDGIDISPRYEDCGLLLFDRTSQDVHAGGSGCGCGASVLCGRLLDGMREGRWKKLLFCATGALLSPTTAGQGESIPGICHAVSISTQKEV